MKYMKTFHFFTGGPPPFGAGGCPDIFGMGDFGELEHTGGIPPWNKSPLPPPGPPIPPHLLGAPCIPPCNPPCVKCRPPDYNRVCDPKGAEQ